jgi:hypothetical protein
MKNSHVAAIQRAEKLRKTKDSHEWLGRVVKEDGRQGLWIRDLLLRLSDDQEIRTEETGISNIEQGMSNFEGKY